MSGAGTSGDQAVREQALSLEESFIVQAPAGSGKTELLIQRYLNLLGYVSEPEEIIAVTFTRKAAGEMRERVVEALRKAAEGEVGEGAVEVRRLELARRAIDNDRRRNWQLVDHPARLRIQTIDALSLSLIRQLPVLSGFAAPAGILDDAGAMYRKAASETLGQLGGPDRQWQEALTRLLRHVDNDLARATELIASMLASRDQWLRHIGEGDVSSEALHAAWSDVIEAHLEKVAARFPEDSKALMVECADAAAAALTANGDAPGARAWLEGEGFPEARFDELPRWLFIVALLTTQQNRFRKKPTVREGFPPGSAAKPSMERLLDDLARDETLPEVLGIVRLLPDPRPGPQSGEILDAMVTVLKLAVAQLQVVFEEAGRVDFVEVTQRAIMALGALEDPSDLALKLDHRIRHILVDEFQDTSVAQYQLLRLLTQGWAPEDGRTVFLVGDPMQSIYRFREAEVGLFLRVWEHGLDTVPVRPLGLQSNFRSVPGIVEWVNDAFEACFPEASDLQSGAVSFAPSTARRTSGADDARVHWYPMVDRPESAQSELLAELAGQSLERSGDVAVLVRARSHLGGILTALQARGIPYSGTDIFALINEPAVRDLYSLTRALLHPGDRMAWLSLLRGPWCGLTLDDLLAVAAPGTTLVWDALRDRDVRTALSPEGRARLDGFIRAMDDALAARGRLTLRQWVRRAWAALGGPASITEAELAHVRTYLDLLGQHQAGISLADDRAFSEALNGHWAHAESGGDAVQLMTIHKAKGLEFDEVFLPALDRSIQGDEKRLLLWEERAEAEGLLLATMAASGEHSDEYYRYLRDLQAEKSRNETDRLLYVACTRARERLHLMAGLQSDEAGIKAPRHGSLLQRIWPGIRASFGAADSEGVRPGGPAGLEAGAGQRLRRLPLDWQPSPFPGTLPAAESAVPVDEQHVEFSWAGETARQVGILAHELMQRIAEEGLDRWDDERVRGLSPGWRARLAHIGVPEEKLDEAVQRAADAVGNLLRDQRAGWLLSLDHESIENELEVSMVAGDRVRRLRVDRTFVDRDDVRWIVDYKTGTHEGGAPEAFLDREMQRYAPQMETYANAFRCMEDREIRLGLYFPLLQGWREWTFQG